MSLNFGNIWSTGSKPNTININNSRRKYTQNKLVLPVKRPTQKTQVWEQNHIGEHQHGFYFIV